MKDILQLLKEGNKPSLLAAIVNTIIATLKGVAFFFTGNVAMFAETMHSLGDAANQYFVFIGSALSKKAPTPKFPNGFGRVVNLVCLGAVIVVAIMSYEAIKEGWHHILNPTESSGFLINLSVLGIAIILEFVVLYKAGKEILHEVGIDKGGLAPITTSFKHLNKAKPPTKLVFMEDLVATLGGVLAFIAVLIAHFFGLLAAEGIASILIGLMMFYVVGKIFMENARGAIGETDEEMLDHIAHIVAADDDVKDIQRLEVVKEGEFLHVEVVLEVAPSHTVAYVDDIRDRLMKIILNQKGVQDVIISFDEDDGVRTWTESNKINMNDNSSKFPE
ncbi:cation diffusion facilitator family transporter [Sporosarcina ureilytica]|uniref:Cation diffusion facilitator family transporter n=1 Tax=Sporosarcina ureilytica TaxID=298596 RepID=A0A1D8JE87_9BACL|nr:cation diffusion facilitator family transporter [Sporosarcina ureilytica]AOV07021.1 cation diffusion facilitator family transporter [Sporosarcina ureilytica]